MLPTSTAAQGLSPFLAMQIMERAQELEARGVHIAHLEVGEPSFDTPECVQEAARKAMAEGRTHYTHSLGDPELREAIANDIWERYRANVSTDNIVVTGGSSGGLLLTMAALFEPGDELLLPDPYYACYPNFVRALHGKVATFPLDAADGYRYDRDVIKERIGPRTRALMINSPANPTGAMQSFETMGLLATLEKDLWLISDEIYHGLEWGKPARSLLQVTDRGIILNGFSKRFAMTGWRLGWMVVPSDLMWTIQRLQQNLFICASSVAQAAGIAALREAGPDLERMRDELRARRTLLLDGLKRIGLPAVAEPQGAYYAFVDARHLSSDSVALAERILEEAHVGVTPGVDFGPAGEGHLRFSFASSREDIETGLERLEGWLSAL